MGYKVPVGLCNKHLHLCQADQDILFGKDYQMTPMKPLSQPGQFAAEEKVELVGPKGSLKGIRVLGPCRPETQGELAMTDARALGIQAPIRESGSLEGTPGLKIIGPKGEVEIDHGVIIAWRHVHLTDEQAKEAGVVDRQIVSLKFEGFRGGTLDNVLVRAGVKNYLDIHIDTDEGNALGLSNSDFGEIIIHEEDK